MKARQIGTVTLPARPTSGMALLPWCNGVNNALQQLRDRGIDVKGQGGRIYQQRIQFEAWIDGLDLVAHEGTIHLDTISTQREVAAADGDWYLEAKLVIDDTTGEITSGDVYWTQTTGTQTTTDYFALVAFVTVTAGVPDPLTFQQFAYGPLIAIVGGGLDTKWIAYLI